MKIIKSDLAETDLDSVEQTDDRQLELELDSKLGIDRSQQRK
jgi:hypothetical protein